MPLMSCPECSKEISDAAVACPHCGYPLSTESVSSQVSDEDTARVPNTDEPEPSSAAANNDDIGKMLHASIAHRSRMMFFVLAGLIGATILFVLPLFVGGLLKAFDSAGVSFSDEDNFKSIIGIIVLLFSYYVIKWIAEEIGELKFFACADDIDRDERPSPELADGEPPRVTWHQIERNYGGIFFDVTVSKLVGQYFYHYKIRWGVGLAVLVILVLKGLST